MTASAKTSPLRDRVANANPAATGRGAPVPAVRLDKTAGRVRRVAAVLVNNSTSAFISRNRAGWKNAAAVRRVRNNAEANLTAGMGIPAGVRP
jgi:hypothetical protein